MFKKFLPLLLLILSVFSLHAQTLPPPANVQYTNIDLPGEQTTFPTAINASGQIAGGVEDLGGAGHGYRVNKDGSNLMIIDFPGARGTQVESMNSRGDMVGLYFDSAFVQHGFLLRDGLFSTIDFPNSFGNLAEQINDRGEIAGFYATADGSIHGYLFDDGEFTTIDDPNAPVINGPNNTPITETFLLSINNHGVIAGFSSTGVPNFLDQSFVLSHGEFDYIAVPASPGGTTIRQTDDAGNVIGAFVDINQVSHGFLLSKGEFNTVDFPGGAATAPGGINSSGEIVGSYLDDTGNFHGFLATNQPNNNFVISQCPTVITQPGTYSLANDLMCFNTDGIDIQASNVNLMLNGHTITQDSAHFGLVDQGVSAGVGLAGGSTNIEIFGPGTITGFSEGVNFEQVTNSMVEDVTSTRNFFGFVVNGGFTAGCGTGCPSTGIVYEGNTATFNSQHGFTLNGANNNIFEANNSSNNGQAGILLFAAVGNQLRANTTSNNGGSGIGAVAGGGTGNNIQMNTAQGNSIFDLEDDNANCDSNVWMQNTFVTANQTCIH